MKSTTGEYYLGLDHIRALAAFMVFSWHFVTFDNFHMSSATVFPFSILTEGHTGVALFMTLSGYLFAKLLSGKEIDYLSFMRNRALRLLPLLLIVLLIVGVRHYFNGGDPSAYLKSVFAGLLKPTLPWIATGGWSIVVEFHFYLILPVLLYCSKTSKYTLPAFLLFAVLGRYFLYLYLGEIQTLSYWTIVGRIDQFVLGIVFFQCRDSIKNRHGLAVAVLIAFALFYWYFESLGGFLAYPTYPSPSPLWVFMTTVEGASYGLLIAWYDNSFKHSRSFLSRFIAAIGTYSYSIYLLHFFLFAHMAEAVNRYLYELSNVYVALSFVPLAFLCMVPIGYLSFRFLESPFLRYRSSYIK